MDSKTIVGLLGLAGIAALAYNYSKDTEENYVNYNSGLNLTEKEYKNGLKNGFSVGGYIGDSLVSWQKSEDNMSTMPVEGYTSLSPKDFIMARNTAQPNIRKVTVTGLSDSIKDGTADVSQLYDPRDTASSLGCGYNKENFTKLANSVSGTKLVLPSEQRKEMLNTSVENFTSGDMTTEYELNGEVPNVVANPLMYSLVTSRPSKNFYGVGDMVRGDVAISPLTLKDTLYGASSHNISDLIEGGALSLFGNGASSSKLVQCKIANTGAQTFSGVSLSDMSHKMSMANNISSESNLNSQATRLSVGQHQNPNAEANWSSVTNMYNNQNRQ